MTVISPHVSILVVDDHPSVRETLRTILSADPAMSVTAEAADGDEALELVGAVHPQVVIMDIGLPGVDGIEATLKIRDLAPDSHVVIVTVREEGYYLHEAFKAGAVAYVLKRAMAHDLLTAIAAALRREPYVSPLLLSRLPEGMRRDLPPMAAS